MILGDAEIVAAMQKGDIVIEPFQERNLGTDTYDVSLGEFYYREQNNGEVSEYPMFGGYPLYNPVDEVAIRKVWGQSRRASKVKEILKAVNATSLTSLKGFQPDDRVIFIYPGETILAHTIEFIGGVKNHTTKMFSRSSVGRSMLGVCKCAGRGDVGYFNRWTMEITSFSKHHIIPLKVGQRVAQIEFQWVEHHSKTYTDRSKKYQSSQDVKSVVNSWTPEMMLPKLHRDIELAPKHKTR